jgi:hypothetical protein
MQVTRVWAKKIVQPVHWAKQKRMGKAIALDVINLCSQTKAASVNAMLDIRKQTMHALLVKGGHTNLMLQTRPLRQRIVIQ